MDKVIYNLVFNRKKRLNARGEALIQVEAYLNRRKRYFSTRIYVRPCQWDNKRRAVKNHPNQDGLNRLLREFVVSLERTELELRRRQGHFSLRDLGGGQDSHRPSSFIDFLRDEIAASGLRLSTRKNHLSTLRLLAGFRPGLRFDELDCHLLRDLERHLLDRGYHRNTIAKHMKQLKRYVNLAIDRELIDPARHPFRQYKIRHQESRRAHLTPEELARVERLALPPGSALGRVRDMFLFSCYTGLRFSDITRISPADFHPIDGSPWLVYATRKTDTGVRLPLALLFGGKAIPIYERYRASAGSLFGVSPGSNSNVNKRLRELCRLAGIDKRVTFHAARHTNATLLLYDGARLTTVQKLLGHKSIRTTEIYSDIMDMTIVRDLERISR